MNKFLTVAIGTTLFLTSLTHCGNTELTPAQKPAAEQQSTFFTRLNAVTWTTIEHRGSLTIKSPAGRDSSSPLLITEVFPELIRDANGPAQSILPGDSVEPMRPFRLVASGDIVVEARTHLLVPSSLHLKGSKIFLNEGATLEVEGDVFIEADRYEGHARIIAKGTARDVVLYGKPGLPGADGSPGKHGLTAECGGISCEWGSLGGYGSDGKTGAPGGAISLRVPSLRSTDNFITRGGRGGAGGRGGNGGNGGGGACCFLSCKGGCGGGAGGDGGNGGDGGVGGDINIEYCNMIGEPNDDASGGDPGSVGTAGSGGDPGPTGCSLTGCFGTAPAGKPGKPGLPGSQGSYGGIYYKRILSC